MCHLCLGLKLQKARDKMNVEEKLWLAKEDWVG